MSLAVEIENVTKQFGQQVAVNDLSLTVPEGSIYGFIGPNGSGKTTTLRMIMRILHPDSGRLRVLGEERWSAVHDRVAYLPEERGLYKQMTVRDVLKFNAALKGLYDSGPAIDSWLERLHLSEHADKKVNALSKGMSQKVQFIATVVAMPELVLLDEPFSGLDPVNADVLREAILDLRKSGTTVIFSTHDMAVAEDLCDAIFMIYKGNKVLDGSLDSIQAQFGQDTVRVKFDGPAGLENIPGVVKVADLGNLKELRLDSRANSQSLLAELMRRGTVTHFEVANPSLHEIFVRIARPSADDLSEN